MGHVLATKRHKRHKGPKKKNQSEREPTLLTAFVPLEVLVPFVVTFD
jgi:hypothetical protein